MGTNCAPLVADLFLFCYERSKDNQTLQKKLDITWMSCNIVNTITVYRCGFLFYCTSGLGLNDGPDVNP